MMCIKASFCGELPGSDKKFSSFIFETISPFALSCSMKTSPRPPQSHQASPSLAS
jgi:hypothetical protein